MGFKRDKEDFYKEYEKQVTVPIYDRLFHSQEGWDQRKHRDDAEYLPDIQINARHEDSFRTVPISDSAIYGKRDKHFYDLPDTSKRRVAVCTREFYSTNTVTTLPPLVGGDKLPNLPYQHREHNA